MLLILMCLVEGALGEDEGAAANEIRVQAEMHHLIVLTDSVLVEKTNLDIPSDVYVTIDMKGVPAVELDHLLLVFLVHIFNQNIMPVIIILKHPVIWVAATLVVKLRLAIEGKPGEDNGWRGWKRKAQGTQRPLIHLHVTDKALLGGYCDALVVCSALLTEYIQRPVSRGAALAFIDEIGGDLSACPTLSCFTMGCTDVIRVRIQPLFGVLSKSNHHREARRVMVRTRKVDVVSLPEHRHSIIHFLDTQIHHPNLILVVVVEEIDDLILVVAIQSLTTFGRQAHGNNILCDI